MPLVQQGITVVAHRWAVWSLCRPICKKKHWRIMTLSSLGFRCWTTQSALSLLLHCVRSLVNCLLRVIRPELVQNFAEGHNAGLRRCLAQNLPVSTGADPIAKATASFPLSMGGLGLWDASRTSEPAFWASWADWLSMIWKRHPEVALEMVRQLNGFDACPSVRAASRAARELTGVEGFEPSTWDALANGLRPPSHDAGV